MILIVVCRRYNGLFKGRVGSSYYWGYGSCFNKGGSSKNVEKWVEMGYILEVEMIVLIIWGGG